MLFGESVGAFCCTPGSFLQFKIGNVGDDCKAGSTFYNVNVGVKNSPPYPHTADTTVILMDSGRGRNHVPPESHPSYNPTIDCCGRVVKWRVDFVSAGGEATLQIWRPLGNNRFLLVGDGFMDSPDGGVHDILPTSLLYTHAGDKMGFTSDRIEWSEKTSWNGVYCGWVLAQAGLNPSPGDTYLLATEHTKTQDNSQASPHMIGFGLEVHVEPRDDPECTIYLNPDTITESTPIGTSIGRVTTSRQVDDNIPGYNFSWVNTGGLTGVDLDPITGDLTTNTNLTVKIPPNSDTFNFIIQTTEMICFKIGQCKASLTLEFVNHPPEIPSLPAGSKLIESTTSAKNIALIETTDENRNTNKDLVPTCIIVGSVPALAPFTLTRNVVQTKFDLAYDGLTTIKYDFVKQFLLVILCTDDYFESASGTYTVTVEQNLPPGVANSIDPITKKIYSTADARTIKKGDAVLTLSITDKEGDYINTTYDAIGAFSPFYWDPTAHAIRASQDLLSLEEDQIDFDFRAEVWDEWNRPSRYSLNVHMVGINSPPAFTNCQKNIELREDRPAGFLVFKAGTIDDNYIRDNQRHTFSMGVSPVEFTDTFTLNTADGSVTVSGTGRGIDYENTVALLKGKSIKLDIGVNDGIHSAKLNCEISVNIIDVNEAPTLVKDSFVVNMYEEENWPQVLPGVLLQVNDADTVDTNMHKFELLSSSNPGGYFSCDSSTGVVRLIRRCDLEDSCPSKFTLLVTVKDPRGLETSATITVNILDKNDNKPVFGVAQRAITITSDTPTSQVLAKVSATDADPGTNGLFTYHMSGQGFGSLLFTVSQSGEVRLRTKPTFPVTTTFTITVGAKDQGTPFQEGYTNIEVTWYVDPNKATADTTQREQPCLTCTGAGVAIVTATAAMGVVLLIFIGWQVYRFCGESISERLTWDKKPLFNDGWNRHGS